jgi:hypothetical protein
MSDAELPPLRKEVQGYAYSCEHLLSSAGMRDSAPFSVDELQIINYYADEVAKMLLLAKRL